MTIRLRWVPYGRPAAEALRGELSAAKGGDALAPVNVIVPSNQVGVTARRLLGSGVLGATTPAGSGFAAVSFLTVYRMAELLAAPRLAGEGRRPVSTPVIAQAIRAVLADDPGIFGPVAGHEATELALIGAYKELRDCSSDALDRLAGGTARAADVVRLHRSTRSRLARRFFDEEDLLATAVAALGEGVGGLPVMHPSVVYLPDRLSRHAARLLRALADRTALVVLAGTTGEAEADAETLRAVRRLDPQAPPPLAEGHLASVSAERTRLVTTSDADEEVRAALRVVVDAARSGTPLERMAILYPTSEPYARLLDERLAAAEIARNGAGSTPLTARIAGRTLLGLLGLARAGFRREDVFAWLAGAPLHRDGQPVPVAAWERLSREAGVVAGRDQWDHRLGAFAAGLDEEALGAAGDPDLADPSGDRQRGEAGRARDLRRFVLALIDGLAWASGAARSWAAYGHWARTLLDELLPGRRRDGWPLAEQRAAGRVERALERLGGLEGDVGLELFARTLALELDADPGRVGRLGEGVLVGPLSFGAGVDLDLLVVVGMAEGTLPTTVRDDSLLPDHERERAGGDLSRRAEGAGRQLHALLTALAGARRHVLVVPRGDLRRASERAPSRWATDVAAVLAGRPLSGQELLGLEFPFVEHVASFDAGLRKVEFPATAQEHRLRALLAAGSRPRPEALGDAVLSAATAVVRARRSERFTRFDGNLAGLAVPSPAAVPTSATGLEHWASCPFAYLLERVLGVDTVENPEDRLTISPPDLGSLVHEVLEAFMTDVIARPDEDQPRPGDPWGSDDRDLLVAHAGAVCDRYEAHGRVGRPIFWQRDRRRLLADLDRFLAEDGAHRAVARTRPVAAELAFGLPGARLREVSLALPDGRSVRFRGKADRLDVAEDGSAQVLDYKTGRGDGYGRLDADDPADRGRHLQLAVYALAARAFLRADVAVDARYWFATSTGGFRRVGYEVTPELLARVGETVQRMVAGIEAGLFPSSPPAAGSRGFVKCPSCDPDGLGVTELRRQTVAKRQDPALAALVALADGPLAGAGDVAAGAEEAPGA